MIELLESAYEHCVAHEMTLADRHAARALGPVTDPRTPEGERWLRGEFEKIRARVTDAASLPSHDVLERVIRGNLKPVGERTTSETYWEHILLRYVGDVRTDIERNYAQDLTLSLAGSARLVGSGHPAIERSARLLHELLATTRYIVFDTVIRDTGTEGGWVTERWAYRDDRIKNNQVVDGIDTFLIKGGKIRVKMIHYTVERAQEPHVFHARLGLPYQGSQVDPA